MSDNNQKEEKNPAAGAGVDFEEEAEKERKQMLEQFFNDLNRNPNAQVTEKMMKARYSVQGSKAKAMVKLYKNQRNILKYFNELAEVQEEKIALEDLLKREGQTDDKQRKQLKNLKSRIEALEKGIAKAQKYAGIRTEEILKTDTEREAPVSKQEEEAVTNIKLASLQKENRELHDKHESYRRALATMPQQSSNWFTQLKNWFVKKHYLKKEQEYRLKLYKNELDLAAYQKDKELEDKRRQDMVMPDWEEVKKAAGSSDPLEKNNDNFNFGAEGDLEYHKFTGRGPSARHHSEIFDKRDKTIEAGSFKEKVLSRVNGYIDRNVQKIETQIAEQERNVLDKIAKDNLKNFKSADIESVKKDLDLALRYDEEYKRVNEEIFSLSGEEERIQKRLKNIKSKLSSVEKRISKKTKAKQEVKRTYSDDKLITTLYYLKYKKTKAAFEKIDAKVNILKRGLVNASFTKEEYDEWSRLKAETKKYYDLATEYRSKQDKREQEIKGYDTDMDSLKAEIADLKAEEEMLKKGNPSDETRLEFLKSKQKILAQAVKINKKTIVGYEKLLKYNEAKKELLSQKEGFEKQKESAVQDVLAAEESTVLLNDKNHTEVKGMFVNDMVYFDEEKLESEGISLYDKKKENLILNGDELLKKREVQKIVKALKSRPIFTFLNSDTIMEYMSYDELSGEFRLAKEGITEEEKKVYDQKFRAAYFGDDSTIVNRKIQNNPGLLKAFGNVMWDIGKAAFNEGWPEGLGAFGIDSALAMGIEKYEGLEKILPDNFKGRGVEDEIKYRRLRNGIREAADNILTIADKPSIGNIFHTNCCVAIKDANSTFFLKNTGFDLNALGLGAYVLDIIQFGTRIATAQKDINKQKAEMEAMMSRHHKRFATVMKAAKTESEVERMKAVVSSAFSLARDAVLMSTGITGFATDLVSMTCKIVTKAVFSGIMRGKNNNEILNDPEVLGGIDYNKNIISEDEFNQVLSSVTGFKSKKDLANAMHVINGVDLHRAALKSLKEDKPNLEADRSMHALGFGDRRRYDKVKVIDILYKTMGASGKWRDNLRETIEYKGVDYDTSVTRFAKENDKKNTIYHYKDSGHKTRRINDFEQRKKLVDELEGKSAFESSSAEMKRVKSVVCKIAATDMYNTFREAERSGKSVNPNKIPDNIYKYAMDKRNRDSMIEMLSQTEIADNRALNMSQPLKSEELYNLSCSAILSIQDKISAEMMQPHAKAVKGDKLKNELPGFDEKVLGVQKPKQKENSIDLSKSELIKTDNERKSL